MNISTMTRISAAFCLLLLCNLSVVIKDVSCATEILPQFPGVSQLSGLTDRLISPTRAGPFGLPSISPVGIAGDALGARNLTAPITGLMTLTHGLSNREIVRETAAGMKSFLDDLRNVITVVDYAIQNPERERDRPTLVGFRSSLDMAYKRTEDLYNRFQSTFEGRPPASASRDAIEPVFSSFVSTSNISNFFSNIAGDTRKAVGGMFEILPGRTREEAAAEIKQNVRRETGDGDHGDDRKDGEVPNVRDMPTIEKSLHKAFRDWADAITPLGEATTVWSIVSNERAVSRAMDTAHQVGQHAPSQQGTANNAGSTAAVKPSLRSFSLLAAPASSSLGDIRSIYRSNVAGDPTSELAGEEGRDTLLPFASQAFSAFPSSLMAVADQAVTSGRDLLNRATSVAGSPSSVDSIASENAMESFYKRLQRIIAQIGVGYGNQ